ncbi:MAG: HEAT repeat domain-containing protein [Sphingobacteriia bacterium]|nr:HEAT repeat domain-containing protein [Sphingobacteriia bacterium]
MRKYVLFLALTAAISAQSQTAKEEEGWKKEYRAFATKENDLIHTKLDAKFDYANSYLNGKVWITAKPHLYPTNIIQLDAKGMNIYTVSIVKEGKKASLKYVYDSTFLIITLDRQYKSNEQYTLYIEYTAKPNEYKGKGSAAISDAKGLYFINPKGEEKNKPTQIWTQGETESNSVWIPTIDKPNQKMTDEIYMTVPAKYVTLSNGKLVSQTPNANGTRTDYWKMDLPHAPYLLFMGVGEYAIVKDTYKGKEVNYYVEKDYEKLAKKIFGYTPEMIRFYSEKVTGIDYPWQKYSQIVGRDYVSGAMENTTSTLHGEGAQQDARELKDGNIWEETIAHELFHQWFGDYVTCESWSNLTVNESFANYSEYLWAEYKHGKDEADFINMRDMSGYIQSPNGSSKDLVRFFYADKEDMFDEVSYNKGGRILHMLRNYVGDEAFFKSLNRYLNANKFGNGNATKLKLAFEEVTGKDLNWFFNQWYFGSGHPKLDITYGYNAETRTASIIVKQNQTTEKVFQLPVAIDIYIGKEKKRHSVWVEHKTDTFNFTVSSKPDLINFDADKILLAEKKENKTLSEYIHQFKNAGKYLDRREAVEFASKNMSNPDAYKLMTEDALNDSYFRIRMKALTSYGTNKLDEAAIKKIETIAVTDASTLVRAAAIDILAKQKNTTYAPMFLKATADSSYTVAGAALDALAFIDSASAIKQSEKLVQEPNKGRLATAIANISIKYAGESAFSNVADAFEKMPLSQEKLNQAASFSLYLQKVNTPVNFKRGVDLIVDLRDKIPEAYKTQTSPFINSMLTTLKNKKQEAGQKELADYVQSKL